MMAPSGDIFSGGGGDRLSPDHNPPLDLGMQVNLFSYNKSTITIPFQTSDDIFMHYSSTYLVLTK